jgi:hypothetical protein
MSIASATSQTDFRAVVALNNMAITLLERHYHSDAMVTLKDALKLMGSLVNCHRSRPSFSAVEKTQMLEKASQRVARSTRSGELSSSPPDFLLSVLSEDNSEALRGALHLIPSEYSGAVILISFDEINMNLTIDASILLYNFSVASRINARVATKANRRSQLINRAYEFAQVADSNLSQESHSLDDLLLSERALMVSVLVLQELVQLSSQRGDMSTSRKYYCELGQLRSFLTDSEDFNFSPVSQNKVASAA